MTSTPRGACQTPPVADLTPACWICGADWTSPSINDNGEGYLLGRATMQWFWAHYLGATDPSDDPYTLDRKWEYEPLLWTATDESTHPWKYPHHGHGHAALTSAELIGGTASGKW